ncbi:MAG: IPT/TIG domain-containing protein [Myxococcota bacterium]|nr:IPT/TIG domain-containing protein [Myxococcota bacterium]
MTDAHHLATRGLRLLGLSLLLGAVLFSGCSGCGDELDPPSQDEMGDSGNPSDMPGLPDMPPSTEDMPLDPEDMDGMDMQRPPRKDMPISMFDFGTPDMAEIPFTVSAVVPPSGPLAGDTLVRINGTALEEGTRVFLGGVEMEVEVLGGVLIGRTPPGSAPGPVSLKAVSPDGDVADLEDAYTYTTTLRIDEISPAMVPTTGGVEVVVRGAGFGERAAISFSGTDALRVEFVEDTLLRVITPPRPRGPADVRLTTPDGSLVLEDAITYFEPLSIERITPAAGLTAGGDSVVIKGKGFETGSKVFFDGEPVAVGAVSAQAGTITITTPAHAPGSVDVSVQNSRETALRLDGFTYLANTSPTLLSVDPAFGPEAGGQEVFVTGYGFDAPGVEVLFGASSAMILEAAPTYARVQTPARAPGAVDVVMRDGSGELARLSNAYEYRPALAIDSVSPDMGGVEGGLSVTLTGQNIGQAERVWFGGLRATIADRPGTNSLIVTTPAHTAGAVAVRAERAGIEATLEDAFTYTEPLEVWGFTPTRGAVAGQTYVEVRGRGFLGALEASLGARRAPLVRRIDRNNLYLYTPAGAPGEVSLTVRGPQGEDVAPYPFLYFNPATRFGGASGDGVTGSVNVSVFATGGAPIENAFVMLSTRPDTRYQGMTDVNGQLTLSGPDVLGSQTVTATAAGYSSTTVTAVDAENVTIFLSQLNPRPGSGAGDPPPFGIIRGTVTSLGKLADPNDQSTYDMAIVGTTSPYLYGGNPNPGEGSVVIGQGDYEIVSRIGDLSVVALCGVFNETTETFDPQFMAVERYLVVSDQNTYDVDLLCDIPLDKSLDVKLVNPIYNPEGPDNNVVEVYWDFGFEGYFPSPVRGQGLSDIINVPRLPSLAGDLADVSFTVVGGSYTGLFSPYTETSIEDVTDTAQVLSLPPLLDVPEPLSPLPGGVIVNREIRWEARGPYFPDMSVVTLRNAEGIPVWTFTVPGTQTSVRVPEFPDFSGLPVEQRPNPYTQNQLFLTITSVRIPQFSYDSFTYEDFGGARWEAFSLSRWAVQFPTP